MADKGKEKGTEMRGSVTTVNVGFYRCAPESNIVLGSTKHKISPGQEVELVLSHLFPTGQYKMQTADWVQNV